jgi:hypothetical protein
LIHLGLHVEDEPEEKEYTTDCEGDTPVERLLYKYDLHNQKIEDVDPKYKQPCIEFLTNHLEDLKDKLDDDDFEEPDIIMLDKALEAAKILSFDDPQFI